MNSKNNYLDWAIQLFFVAALVLVPSYFTSMIHNAFTIEKHVVFRVCALIILALTVAREIYFPRRREIPKIFWLVPLFWLTALISTIFALNPAVSLWGIHLRMDGLVTMSFFVVYFVCLYLHLYSRSKLRQLLWAVCLGSIIPVGYAIFQKLGFDPVNWKGVVVAERVFGTTGNPAYLGAYLLFVIPITFYLAVIQKNWKKYLLFLLLLLQILTVTYTWTRAAYLGLFVESFLLLFGYFYFINQKKVAGIITGIYAFLIFFIIILNVSQPVAGFFANTPYIGRYVERVAQFSQLDSGTGKDRLEMWRIAAGAIKEHPLFGTGFSSYYYHFNLHYPNYMDSRPETDRYSNYPHNLVLDTGVSHGLIGIALLLAIIFSFLYFAVKSIFTRQKTNQQLQLLALSVVVSGYFVQALFNIETIITWTYFYTFLAIILAATFNIDQEHIEIQKNMSITKQIAVTLTVIGCLLGIYFLAINPAQADRNYLYINNNSGLTNEQKLKLADTTRDLTPYYEYSYMRLSDLNLALTGPQTPSLNPQYFQNAIGNIDLALQIAPANFKNYLSLGLVYGLWAQYDISKLPLAEQALKKAKELSPLRLGLHYSWGNMYIDLNMLDQARQQFLTAQELNPEVGESYYHLAKISYLENNPKEAENYLKQASDHGYAFDRVEFYQKLAVSAYNLNNYQLAATLAAAANQSQPSETTALLEIQSYLDLSQPAVAQDLARKYIKLLPSLESKLSSLLEH